MLDELVEGYCEWRRKKRKRGRERIGISRSPESDASILNFIFNTMENLGEDSIYSSFSS
jgi:hypothetical protein